MTKLLKQTLLGVAAASALGVAAVSFVAFDQVSPALPQNLAALGETPLTSVAGSRVRLTEAVAPHSATLVAFWAPWCVPCRSEATAIAALRRTYSLSDLSILYLNVDDVPDAAATSAFLRAASAENLDVLYAGVSGWKAITGSRVVALPRSYIFDRSGAASTVFSGFNKANTRHELERGVAKALAS